MNENLQTLIAIYVLALDKTFYFLTDDESLTPGEDVIVETSRGMELGKVKALPIKREVKENEEFPRFIKRAELADLTLYKINLENAKKAVTITQDEANKLNLDMKIISAEYTIDSSKILIYYSSESRVDFRELLKILANDFKCRIELRQIGTRDKAKMIGGIGICGLKLCCATFLNEFDGISITMAKNQMLALNIPKLSGHCGKLICCLKYENDAYTDLQKDLPRIGARVKYNDDIYKITSMNVITKIIRLESKDNVINVPYDDIKNCILPREFNPNQQNKKFSPNNKGINDNEKN